MTYSVLKVPLNPNQPTNQPYLGHYTKHQIGRKVLVQFGAYSIRT